MQVQAEVASRSAVGAKLPMYSGNQKKCSISGSEFKNGDVVCMRPGGDVIRVNGYRGPGELTGEFFSFQE